MQVGHAHLTNVVFIIIDHLRLSIAEAESILSKKLLRVAHFYDNDSQFQISQETIFTPAPLAFKKPLMSDANTNFSAEDGDQILLNIDELGLNKVRCKSVKDRTKRQKFCSRKLN